MTTVLRRKVAVLLTVHTGIPIHGKPAIADRPSILSEMNILLPKKVVLTEPTRGRHDPDLFVQVQQLQSKFAWLRY